eukprot:GHVO01032942.1.p1 GENE.GHVO01032942.1~~GHVO01032942.1.p1  ORF type:complete len:151 (+),score=33.13 GHVO01032942.1:513-965(+)
MFPPMMNPKQFDPTALGCEDLPPIIWGPLVPMDVDFSRWKIVYPSYIDSTISISEGRRIRKDSGVPSPTIIELESACRNLGLKYVREDKAYSRDILRRGRVRISPDHNFQRAESFVLLSAAVREIREADEKRKQEAEEAAAAKGGKRKKK